MFPKKLVAIMNEKVEPGKIMNALGHMCLAFGSEVGKEPLNIIDYVDGDGGCHPSSKMPFIILKANSNKIRALRQEAMNAGIQCADFIHTMTDGTYVDQLERSKQTKEPDLVYYGVVLFGEWDKVSELTRKFSLWK